MLGLCERRCFRFIHISRLWRKNPTVGSITSGCSAPDVNRPTSKLSDGLIMSEDSTLMIHSETVFWLLRKPRWAEHCWVSHRVRRRGGLAYQGPGTERLRGRLGIGINTWEGERHSDSRCRLKQISRTDAQMEERQRNQIHTAQLLDRWHYDDHIAQQMEYFRGRWVSQWELSNCVWPLEVRTRAWWADSECDAPQMLAHAHLCDLDAAKNDDGGAELVGALSENSRSLPGGAAASRPPSLCWCLHRYAAWCKICVLVARIPQGQLSNCYYGCATVTAGNASRVTIKNMGVPVFAGAE